MRLDMFSVSSSSTSPVASVDSKSSHSTSELESGINIQKGLHESEDCIEVVNSSITVMKKGEQSIDRYVRHYSTKRISYIQRTLQIK